MADKIKYGICNCYYAKQTTDPTTGAVSFATPVRLPGARSLTLDPEGELTKWYADNVAYWSGEALQAAGFTDAEAGSHFLQDRHSRLCQGRQQRHL